MAGFKQLDNNEVNRLLSNAFSSVKTDKITIEHDGSGLPLSYFSTGNLIFITSPIPASELVDQLARLKKANATIDDKHLLVGLIGRGNMEQHIVTAHRSPEGKVQLFDPKTSDVGRFFAPAKPSFSLGRFFAQLFQSKKDEKAIRVRDDLSVDYSAMGTQSMFDGVSCGYHHVATMLAAAELIKQDEQVTSGNILEKLDNPVREVSTDLSEDEDSAQKVDNRFISFMKKAWFDTFMPLEDDESKRDEASFRHYFLGWPKEKGLADKVAYFATLGFVFKPLASVIKLPTEFLLNALSETASFLKNQLIAWAPKNKAVQSVRSGLMLTVIAFQGLFKGLSLAIRPITSPINSFKAAKQKGGMPLAALSAAVSVIAYAGLAVLVAPIALAALAGAGIMTALAPVINTLATPVASLFAQFGVAVAPEFAALATVAAGSSLLSGLGRVVDNVVSKLSQKSDEPVVKIPVDAQSLGVDDFDPVDSVSPGLSRLTRGSYNHKPRQSVSEDESSDEESQPKNKRDSLIWERDPEEEHTPESPTP